MKVLFISDGIFPFQIGGMQKHSFQLANSLAKKGIKLTLVHCGGKAYSESEFSFTFIEAGKMIEEVYVEFPQKSRFPGHYIRESKAYSKNIYLKLKDRLLEFDVIYSQGFTGWYFMKMKHRGVSMGPITVNLHGLEMFQKSPNTRAHFANLMMRSLAKWCLQNGDYIYSFGAKLDSVLTKLNIPKDRILLHSNGVGEEWLSETITSTRIRTFVFIGRFERRKGIEELHEALKILISKNVDDFRFNFIGPIPESAQIIDYRIKYYGEVRDDQKIREILEQSDCLVCPSHSEGMPTVILEAMAAGLCVIGTNVGAIARQIQDNGILINEIKVEKLESAMEDVINLEDSVLKKWKINSIELVKNNFLWSEIADQKIRNFKKIVAI